MARKRKSDGTEDLLSSAVATALSGGPPGPANPNGSLLGLIEYTPMASTDKWHVERAEEFIIEFDLSNARSSFETQLVQFHELGLQNKRPWLICRRLFGIGPMIPPPDADPKDLRPLSRQELCADFGIEPDQLRAELDALRALWKAQVTHQERSEPAAAAEHLPQAPKETLNFGEDILLEFGFEDTMFNVTSYNPQTKEDVARSAAANRVERNWFCKRIQEWAKMLSEPGAGAVAREALLNELYLRRFGQEMSVLGPTSKKWQDLYESKKQIEEVYQKQIANLQEMFPEIATANKTGFKFVISDIIRAHRDYYAHQDRQLVDKLNTAAEIEVLIRQSAQAPEPKYRFGMNMAIVEAIHNLHDPDWRPQFKHAVLKKLDAGFKEGVARMREALNEPLVDLEKGVQPGEGDDFDDLQLPPNENETQKTQEGSQAI
jgi:hypothetical protein